MTMQPDIVGCVVSAVGRCGVRGSRLQRHPVVRNFELGIHYLRQEVFRSVVFVCWLVRSFVHLLVNIRPTTALAGRRPAGCRTINIALAFRTPGGGWRPTRASSSSLTYILLTFTDKLDPVYSNAATPPSLNFLSLIISSLIPSAWGTGNNSSLITNNQWRRATGKQGVGTCAHPTPRFVLGSAYIR